MSGLRYDSHGSGLTRRRLLGGLAIAGAGAATANLAAACTTPTPTATTATTAPAARSTVLNIDLETQPVTVLGLRTNAVFTAFIVQQVEEYLYTWSSKLEPEPLLAADLPKALDPLNYDIPLKKGVTFHNGDEFNAEQVVASFNAARVAPNVWRSHLDAVDTIKAIDASTVRFTLKRPFGLFMQKLQVVPVIHKDWTAKADSMMGTGPFVFDEWKAGSHIRLKANAKYWGGAPKISEIVFRFVSDPGARLVNLLRGNTALFPQLDYQYAEFLRNESDIAVLELDAAVQMPLRVNVANKPLDDVRVRQALGYAMDRTKIVDVVFKGKATIGQGPLGPVENGGKLQQQVYPARPDFDRAKSLLREAGIKEGQTFNFLWIARNQGPLRDLGAVLKEDWAKIGVRADLTFLEPADFAARTSGSSTYGMKVLLDFSGTSQGLEGLTQTLNIDAPNNTTNVRDKELHDLEQKGEATLDPVERGKIGAQWSTLANQRGYWMTPAYPKFLVAHRKELQGISEWLLVCARIDLRKAQLT